MLIRMNPDQAYTFGKNLTDCPAPYADPHYPANTLTPFADRIIDAAATAAKA